MKKLILGMLVSCCIATTANAGWFGIDKSDAVVTKDQVGKFIAVNPLDLSDVADCDQLNEKLSKAFDAADSSFDDTMAYLNSDSVAEDNFQNGYQGLYIMANYLGAIYGANTSPISNYMAKTFMNTIMPGSYNASQRHLLSIQKSFQNCTGSGMHRLSIAYNKAYAAAEQLQNKKWGKTIDRICYNNEYPSQQSWMIADFRKEFGKEYTDSFYGLCSIPKVGAIDNDRVEKAAKQFDQYVANAKAKQAKEDADRARANREYREKKLAAKKAYEDDLLEKGLNGVFISNAKAGETYSAWAFPGNDSSTYKECVVGQVACRSGGTGCIVRLNSYGHIENIGYFIDNAKKWCKR